MRMPSLFPTSTAVLLALALSACEGPNDGELCRTNRPDGGCTLHIVCGADCAADELTRDASKVDPADAQCEPNRNACK